MNDGEPMLTLESEEPVQRRRGVGGRVVAGAVGVLVLLGGLAFAVTQAGSSGPSNAEEAVRELLQAASDEDVLGLLAALDPGERDALRGPVEDLFGHLERLEVLDDDFDPSDVGGIDLSFDDVQLRSEPVRDDLVRVYFTGGTVTTAYQADELPIGDFVSDTLDAFGADISGQSDSDTSDITDDDTFLVARNGADGWRVSIGYTAAEAARLDAGLPLPASGVTPVGAESPEAAVEGMIDAIARLDLEGTIARLSPGEMGALHDYAGLFLPDAEAELAQQVEESGVQITVDDLSLRSETSGDRGSVFVDSFAITVTTDSETVSVSTDGECVTVTGLEGDIDSPFDDGPICSGDLDQVYEDAMSQSGFDELGVDMPTFPPFETPEIGISTAEVGGKWYVAPVETALDSAVSLLGAIERSHLDAFVEMVQGFFGAWGVSTETFSETGTIIEGGDFDYAPDDFEDFEDFGEFEEYPLEEYPVTEYPVEEYPSDSVLVEPGSG